MATRPRVTPSHEILRHFPSYFQKCVELSRDSPTSPTKKSSTDCWRKARRLHVKHT